jgi:hypothetical protein
MCNECERGRPWRAALMADAARCACVMGMDQTTVRHSLLLLLSAYSPVVPSRSRLPPPSNLIGVQYHLPPPSIIS